MPRQPALMRHFAPRVGRIAWAAPGGDRFLSGPCQPCQLGPDSGLWPRLGRGVVESHGHKAKCPKTKCPKIKWGSALLPAPTVAAAGTLAFQRLSSPRPSAVPCPSVSRSFERSASGPLGRPVLPASRLFLSVSAFSPAASAVPDRMGLAVAGAVAACLPRYRVSGCCWRVAFSCPSSTAPCGASLAGLAFGRIPQGEEGPFRASRRAAPRLAIAGRCPRFCNHRPCRIRLASGRRSGIRNRSFRSAIRLFQNAPQHAESGFIAYFSVRPDREIYTFGSVPCGAFPKLLFPLDKVDAAPRP